MTFVSTYTVLIRPTDKTRKQGLDKTPNPNARYASIKIRGVHRLVKLEFGIKVTTDLKMVILKTTNLLSQN